MHTSTVKFVRDRIGCNLQNTSNMSDIRQRKHFSKEETSVEGILLVKYLSRWLISVNWSIHNVYRGSLCVGRLVCQEHECTMKLQILRTSLWFCWTDANFVDFTSLTCQSFINRKPSYLTSLNNITKYKNILLQGRLENTSSVSFQI